MSDQAHPPFIDSGTSFVDRLLVVHDYRKTGVLEVRAADLCTFVYVLHGIPVFAEGGSLDDSFGRVLRRKGLLTEKQYVTVIRKMTDDVVDSEQMRFGEAAVTLGFVSHEQINDALTEQVPQIVLPAPSVPGGMTAVIMVLDQATCDWLPLPTAYVAGESLAVAALLELTQYAAITMPEEQSCGTFTPCGGDITGNWSGATRCPSQQDSPFPIGACSLLGDMSGTSTSVLVPSRPTLFDLDGSNFKWRGSGGFVGNATYKKACFDIVANAASMAGISVTTCAELGNLFLTQWGVGVGYCYGNPAVECYCDGANVVPQITLEGTYTTNANTITLTPDGQPAEAPIDYCVNGNTLHVEDTTEIGAYLDLGK